MIPECIHLSNMRVQREGEMGGLTRELRDEPSGAANQEFSGKLPTDIELCLNAPKREEWK